MARLSKDFTNAEFKCRCGCGFDTPDKGLITALQALRDLIQLPITVQSGCRCESHNKKVGGAKNSYHCKGMAADIRVKNLSHHVLAGCAEVIPAFNNGGIGVYKGWAHVDIRKQKTRWNG